MSALGFLFDGLDDAERRARLRELRALVAVYCGWDHPVKAALDSALAMRPPPVDAVDEINRLSALQRRRVLASFGALVLDDW